MSHGQGDGWFGLFRELIRLLGGRVGVLRILGILALGSILALVWIASEVMAVVLNPAGNGVIGAIERGLISQCIIGVGVVFGASVAFLAFYLLYRPTGEGAGAVEVLQSGPGGGLALEGRPEDPDVGAGGPGRVSSISGAGERDHGPGGPAAGGRLAIGRESSPSRSISALEDPPRGVGDGPWGVGGRPRTLEESLRRSRRGLSTVVGVMKRKRREGTRYTQAAKQNVLNVVSSCADDVAGYEDDSLLGARDKLRGLRGMIEADPGSSGRMPSWSAQFVEHIIVTLEDCTRELGEIAERLD